MANSPFSGILLVMVSVLYCMTTSLAHYGEGLGTVGILESKMRELCAEAGVQQRATRALREAFQHSLRGHTVAASYTSSASH